MCGIAGAVAFDGGALPAEAAVTALGAALAHRGPDGAGTWHSPSGRAALVHRRLAVIDPHPRAAQPMATPDGRYWLVFNGEIYNYPSLRAQLADTVAWRTASDTEVLLHLLARHGPGALARLRGMFALALWDERAGSLLVARDRFGMKPLYLSVEPGRRAAFASEIGALTRSGLAAPEPSPAGVLAYLRWASIPAPLSWARGVEALEPGTWRVWPRDGAERRGRFADARQPYVDDAAPVTAGELRARCAAAVADSVRAHLVADVPVGVFLSSGIDSGAVATTARAVSAGPLHTYTVTLDDTRASEGPLAREVAARLGTHHHELRVDAHALHRDLDAIVARLDQPTADAVNSYYVSRAAAGAGVKVVLSGIGGDEMFGGYPSFRRIPPAVRAGRLVAPLLRAGRGWPLPLAAWRASKVRHFAGQPSPSSAYRALRGFFMPEELPALAGPALREAGVWAAAEREVAAAECAVFGAVGPESPAAAVARMETCGFLRSQLLRDLDAVSMAHGLEVRAPLVDHELQAAIWPALGRHPALLARKRLLRDSLARPLPAAVVGQPKRGFTLPFDAWMRGPLAEPVRAGLEALAAGGWIDETAGARVLDQWRRGQAHWSRPWGLAVLGRFLAQAGRR